MRPSRQTSVLLVCTVLTIYFGHHAINGRHGLGARSDLLVKAETLKERLAVLSTMHARLEHEAAMLSDPVIDLDMLDETARSALFLAATDEIVVPLPQR